jgi:peroxiredoxin Q/BCP
MTSISINEKAPDFEVKATGDNLIRLFDLKGKNIILYFYPRDNTPGCTQEGQDFRDHYSEFEALDTLIFGISRDSLRTHENFKAKHRFPFELISDSDEILCNLFDVIKIKNMYGKQARGIERSTFLIDKNGKLVAEWRKVKVKVHIEEVLKTLKKINE